MTIWFEGSNELECNMKQVKRSSDDFGKHYVGVISLMPGMKSVKLLEQGTDFVIIKTNEGLMKCTNIQMFVEAKSLVMEFDEEYKAGSYITVNSHFMNEFKMSEVGVKHRTVISNVKAPGLLGFFYRKFGNIKMGNAFLKSYKNYLEKS